MPSRFASVQRGTGQALALSVLWGTLAVTQSICTAQQPEGIIGHWAFNEFRDLKTPDASPCGNVAAVDNVTRVQGVDGSALQFGPDPGMVTCRDVPAVSRAVSVEAWFQPAASGPAEFATVVRKDGAYALRFDGDGRLGFLVWVQDKPRSIHSGRNRWDPGAWYHFVGTYDGARMRLFVNGVEAASSASQEGDISDSGAPCGIGSCRGRYPVQGVIDEVKIYRRSLSAAEAKQAYEAGLRTIEAQKSAAVKPEKLGAPRPLFRKPVRPVKMVVPGFLWVDAEDFAEYGGWTLDTQFVHLMGSGYLLAGAVGKPVEDATTTITVPAQGTYRVWVRARNWVREHSPGRFQLCVNGKPLDKVLGAADSDRWTWENAGSVTLNRGKVTLALHDLTGYFGRCDAILLTTDPDYVPPPDREGICRERARLTGLSLVPKDGGDFDVIVVGGGSAGCPAALASARMGAKTALIQNRPVLGGNSSRECGVPMMGAASGHPLARETGIAEEIHRTRAYCGSHTYSEPLEILTEREPNLTVLLNRHVFDVEMADAAHVATVKAVDTLTGAITVYRGRYFIDCTGDGWVGYFAKADFRLGREARSEHDESLAPPKADRITMSGCIMGGALGFRARDAGKPSPYTRPPWAHDIPTLDGYGRKVRRITGGEWWMEHPGTVDDLWQAETARDELIRIAFGYWDYVKNKSRFQEQASTYVLAYVPYMDAKRESRRLIGDYVLTQNDCTSGRLFPDRIAYGGWPLDVHHAKGIFSGSEGSFHCNQHVPIYTIPYRCLYSRNIENLLFAGRCSSVTHIALGTIRVQSTLATLGQAAGTAAALCVKLGTSPRGIYREHLQLLQQTLLKNDQTIPEIVNEDPDDLARSANVIASSTATHRVFGRENVTKSDLHPMSTDRAMIFRATPGRLQSIRVCISSERAEPTSLTLHLREAKDETDFSSTKDIAAPSATIAPETERWVTFEVNVDVSSPFLWFWLPKTEGLSWRMMSPGPPQSSRAYGSASSGKWNQHEGQYYTFLTTPCLRTPTTVRAENVINGRPRIWAGKTNLWASDPEEPLPQWIELDFGKPTEVSSVRLTFDTDLGPRLPTAARPRECVRDYVVSAHDGRAWQPVVEIKGNWMRHRVHRFEAVSTEKLRLTILATNGDKSARVFEIRAYRE